MPCVAVRQKRSEIRCRQQSPGVREPCRQRQDRRANRLYTLTIDTRISAFVSQLLLRFRPHTLCCRTAGENRRPHHRRSHHQTPMDYVAITLLPFHRRQDCDERGENAWKADLDRTAQCIKWEENRQMNGCPKSRHTFASIWIFPVNMNELNTTNHLANARLGERLDEKQIAG